MLHSNSLHLDTYLDRLYDVGQDPLFIEVNGIGRSTLTVPLFLSWN